MRPFPKEIENSNTRSELWRKYREDMISRAGISIFVFGNKIENGKLLLVNGMESEFNISIEQNNLVVSIGCTGYMTKKFGKKYTEIYQNFIATLIQL